MNRLVVIWFSAVVIMIVTCGAILFAFTDVMSDRLYGGKRTLFVFVLGGYSVFRAFRLKQALKKKEDQ